MSISVATHRVNYAYVLISVIIAVLMGYKFGPAYALVGLPAYPLIAFLEQLYEKLPQALHPIAPWATLFLLFIFSATLMIVAGKAMAETIKPPQTNEAESVNPFSAGDETVASVGRIYVMFQQQLAERAGNAKFDKLAWLKAMQDCSGQSTEPSITEGAMAEIAACADERAAKYTSSRAAAK
ncbi:hypothetical protein [Pseudomonas sp. GXZC]|uniref:hypothetical protein n=1 Tax=Pseudomonas sp. GXZC TaxID=3003351 RepID=UPI0022AA378F|nr:hypothetical protein [Pseudomonas sp. GXZC]WAT32254.1 hypothetical protein OZ428_33805 [Pseudomonas sp. GXZC]